MTCELNDHNYQNPVLKSEGVNTKYYESTCTKCGDKV